MMVNGEFINNKCSLFEHTPWESFHFPFPQKVTYLECQGKQISVISARDLIISLMTFFFFFSEDDLILVSTSIRNNEVKKGDYCLFILRYSHMLHWKFIILREIFANHRAKLTSGSHAFEFGINIFIFYQYYRA